MKKFILLLVICLTFVSIPIYAADTPYLLFKTSYADADENGDINGFEITGGIKSEEETTFDSLRTITGQAPKGTVIEVEVYKLKNDGKSFSKTYAGKPIIVGTSGVFSESIDLSLGDNYILVTATNGETIETTCSKITRKDVEIKRELEKGIVLPG